MEFPFGGHHHHHHHHNSGEDNNNGNAASVQHVSHHQSGEQFAPPPPFSGGTPPPFFEAQPPPRTSSHSGDAGHADFIGRQKTVRIFTKAEENYSLCIRDGKVVLARHDDGDHYQHWIKDMRYSTKVKDEESFPAFALVNKATGEAIKHSFGATHPVQLVPYNPDFLDESVLWTESRDLGDGFRCIRMVNNICLNFDAFNGDEDHGGVHDGTVIVLWEWLKGKNQRWKIAPY